MFWQAGGNGLTAVSRISGFTWPVWAVVPRASQSDGIFAAGDHTVVTRWEVSSVISWEKKQSLKGHSRLIKCMAYSSDLEVLASAGADTKILLWKKDHKGNFEQGAILFDNEETVTVLAFMRPSICARGICYVDIGIWTRRWLHTSISLSKWPMLPTMALSRIFDMWLFMMIPRKSTGESYKQSSRRRKTHPCCPSS